MMTKIKFETLSPKARWDIISALRGPDLVHSGKVKWFTTSVIRAEMSDIMRVGGLVNGELRAVILPKDRFIIPPCVDKYGYATVGDNTFDSYHFVEHVHTAATWLEIPVLWVKGDIYRAGLGSPKVWLTGIAEGSEGLDLFKAYLDSHKDGAVPW